MNWGPFEEKPKGSGLSMSRVIAFLFTLTYCTTLLIRTTTSEMGWPFAALGIVTVMAVPLQALFKSLQSWLMTPPGKKLIDISLTKAGGAAGAAMTTKTTTESSPVDGG